MPCIKKYKSVRVTISIFKEYGIFFLENVKIQKLTEFIY